MRVAELHGVADRAGLHADAAQLGGLKVEKTPAGLALHDKQGKIVGTATASPLKFDPKIDLPLGDRATPDDLRQWAIRAAGGIRPRAFGRREQ